MHSPSKTERLWFSHLLESESLPEPDAVPLLRVDTPEKKKRIHDLLARSEVFDNFLQAKFPNLKRVCRVQRFKRPLWMRCGCGVSVILIGFAHHLMV